jgi:hypothetical protein
MAPQPDKKTGRTPTEEELAKWQRVRPIMNEILQGAGLVKVAEDKVHVTGLKGPLEEGWQKKVEAFAAQIPIEMQGADSGEDGWVRGWRGGGCSVSSPSPSNRACGSPAHGSPTSFTGGVRPEPARAGSAWERRRFR